MKIIRFFLAALLIAITTYLILDPNGPSARTYNFEITEITDDLAECIGSYDAWAIYSIESREYKELEQLSIATVKNINILLDKLKRIKVRTENKELHDKTMEYFNVCIEYASLGSELSKREDLDLNLDVGADLDMISELLNQFNDHSRKVEKSYREFYEFQRSFEIKNNIK